MLPFFVKSNQALLFSIPYRMSLAQLLTTVLLLVVCFGAATAQTGHKPGDQVSIVVRKAERKLQLIRNGAISHEFRVCLGDEPVGHKQFQGDEKTPEGTYSLTYRNENSAFYKSFMLSYPNAKDRAYAKSKGKHPGGAIALHGCGNIAIAALQKAGTDWTDGCIAVQDSELDTLWKYVPVGTRITIRP